MNFSKKCIIIILLAVPAVLCGMFGPSQVSVQPGQKSRKAAVSLGSEKKTEAHYKVEHNEQGLQTNRKFVGGMVAAFKAGAISNDLKDYGKTYKLSPEEVYKIVVGFEEALGAENFTKGAKKASFETLIYWYSFAHNFKLSVLKELLASLIVQKLLVNIFTGRVPLEFKSPDTKLKWAVSHAIQGVKRLPVNIQKDLVRALCEGMFQKISPLLYTQDIGYASSNIKFFWQRSSVCFFEEYGDHYWKQQGDGRWSCPNALDFSKVVADAHADESSSKYVVIGLNMAGNHLLCSEMDKAGKACGYFTFFKFTPEGEIIERIVTHIESDVTNEGLNTAVLNDSLDGFAITMEAGAYIWSKNTKNAWVHKVIPLQNATSAAWLKSGQLIVLDEKNVGLYSKNVDQDKMSATDKIAIVGEYFSPPLHVNDDETALVTIIGNTLHVYFLGYDKDVKMAKNLREAFTFDAKKELGVNLYAVSNWNKDLFAIVAGQSIYFVRKGKVYQSGIVLPCGIDLEEISLNWTYNGRFLNILYKDNKTDKWFMNVYEPSLFLRAYKNFTIEQAIQLTILEAYKALALDKKFMDAFASDSTLLQVVKTRY